MYLSPNMVAATRSATLTNLMTLSTAYIAASERFSSLFLRAGQEALAVGANPAAANPWFGALPVQSTRLLEEAVTILGDAQTAVMQAAESQVQVFDRILFSTIDRAARTSPWEGEVALSALRNTLKNAEDTLHDMTDAAIQSVELAEKQLHQVTESLAEAAPITKG